MTIGLSSLVLKVRGEVRGVCPCSGWMQGVLCLCFPSLTSGNMVAPWSISSSLGLAKGQTSGFRVGHRTLEKEDAKLGGGDTCL